MTLAEQIDEKVRTLPDELAREVLDFVGFIEAKYALKSASKRDLQQAQVSAMSHVWDNPTDDEVWNDL
ncbi:MAG: DUF2281 domain-containing protein [Chromatiaceae bacterium]|nr:DUF2281 domain-containing protein [Chromatiaceae bacterium]MCF7995966.1 DUF2281 domain-containing protein [Chromatiaceae bacterium]